MIKYCIFDLDGTLTDPQEGITKSVQYALRKHGIEVEDRTKLLPFIGPPLLYSFQHFYGLSEEKAHEAIGYYREYFERDGMYDNRAFDGMADILKMLKEKGKIRAANKQAAKTAKEAEESRKQAEEAKKKLEEPKQEETV